MTAWPRIVLASASVAIVAGVALGAAAAGPADSGPWFVISGMVAVVVALQSVTSDARDLAPALLLSLPPVIALASDGSSTWLIGSLGALLLVAGELNALSWECRGPGSVGAGIPRRLRSVAWLALLGLGGSWVVHWVAEVPLLPLFGGMGGVALAAIALAALGHVVLRPEAGPGPPG